MTRFDKFCNLILEVYDKRITSATGIDNSGKTEVTYSDGSSAILTGPRPVRNNNPGNIEYGPFAKANGAVGDDGRYAVFPDVETGTKAQINLLKTSTYQNLTLKDAITRYAPPKEGNNASYPYKLSNMTGISLDTKLSDLSPSQFSNMVDKMQAIEGFKSGNVNSTPSQQYAGTGTTQQDGTSQQPPEGGEKEKEQSKYASMFSEFLPSLTSGFTKEGGIKSLQGIAQKAKDTIEKATGKKISLS